jgi:hypothetical protein
VRAQHIAIWRGRGQEPQVATQSGWRPQTVEETEKMKNYFALYKVISIENGVVNAVYFDGTPLNIEFNPTITPKEAMQAHYPVDSIHDSVQPHDYQETPDEQPAFHQQLAQAGWSATPEQVAAWNKEAEEFFQNSLLSDAESEDIVKRCTCDDQSCPHVCGRCKFPAIHLDIWMDGVTDNLCDGCRWMHCQQLLSNATALRRCAGPVYRVSELKS